MWSDLSSGTKYHKTWWFLHHLFIHVHGVSPQFPLWYGKGEHFPTVSGLAVKSVSLFQSWIVLTRSTISQRKLGWSALLHFVMPKFFLPAGMVTIPDPSTSCTEVAWMWPSAAVLFWELPVCVNMERLLRHTFDVPNFHNRLVLFVMLTYGRSKCRSFSIRWSFFVMMCV